MTQLVLAMLLRGVIQNFLEKISESQPICSDFSANGTVDRLAYYAHQQHDNNQHHLKRNLLGSVNSYFIVIAGQLEARTN